MLNRFFEKITDIKNWIDVYNQFVDKNPNKFKNNLKNISFGKAKRILVGILKKGQNRHRFVEYVLSAIF